MSLQQFSSTIQCSRWVREMFQSRAEEKTCDMLLKKHEFLSLQWNVGSESAVLTAALMKWGAHLHKDLPQC